MQERPVDGTIVGLPQGFALSEDEEDFVYLRYERKTGFGTITELVAVFNANVVTAWTILNECKKFMEKEG